MKRNILLHLFASYSYILNFIFVLLELFPYPIRIIILRIFFRKMGKAPLIDYGTYFRYPKKISIGNNVAINRGCELYAAQIAKEGTILIGNNVVLSPNVKILAAGHDYRKLSLVDTAGPVIIKDFAWIGGNTTILQGVTIGEGAVIGAGSVVTRDIPPYTVAVGNPCRVIKSRLISNNTRS
jgi:acetyltransferase-like isoleucine patch superfamily enzyme